MPNMLVSLTRTICDRARPEEREYVIRDIRQPGLGLRVQPSGLRSWVVRHQVQGRHVRQHIGGYPEVDVKQARQAANAVLAGGMQPQTIAPTAPLFETYQVEHETAWASRFKPEGLRTYRAYVQLQLLPAFAGKRLDAITRPDVVSWFERYSATKPGGANRALDILRQMLRIAQTWGHLPKDWINPAVGIRQNRRKVVGTFLTHDQMARLGAVLERRMAEGCQSSAVLHFLMLTGLRVGEAIALEWRDARPDRLCLRDSKTGPREVPIGRPVQKLISARRAAYRYRYHREDRIFPLPEGNRCSFVQTVWYKARAEAELPPTLRIHDLRHSFASHSVMSGETLFATMRLMGHRRPQTTARYAHLAEENLLQTAETIGALILQQIGQPARHLVT